MELLRSSNVGEIEFEQQAKTRKVITERWTNLGFLDGVEGDLKNNLAILYENQAKQILREGTNANSSGSFETVVFPVIRRSFSKLLANDIVSVQAINMSIGKLFYFIPKTSSRVDGSGNAGVNDYIYGGANSVYSAHTSIAAEQLPACVSSGCNITKYQEKNLYDLFYNDGLFDNSKGKITIGALGAQPVTFGSNGAFVSAVGATLPASNDGTVRGVILKLTGFTSTNKGRLTGPVGNEMDSESFLASLKVVNATGDDITNPDGTVVAADGKDLRFRLVTQQYGKGIVAYNDICDSEGSIYVEANLTLPATQSTFDGFIGVSGFTADTTSFIASYASYSSLENETEMAEVSFEMDSVVVSVTDRKLRATWTPELAQDVSAYHNIDAEAELTSLMSEQVAGEIDREILIDLRKGGAWSLDWDYNGWRTVSNVSTKYTIKEWNQTLVTKINQVAAQIQKATLRGGANFIVVSTEISAVFNDLDNFHATDAGADEDMYSLGISKIGSLGARFKVYVDPFAPAGTVLVGRKGSSIMDTGYIYAPYIPLTLTPTLTNFNTFSSVKGIMTRYAKKMVSNRFYGKVNCFNLQVFDPRELR